MHPRLIPSQPNSLFRLEHLPFDLQDRVLDLLSEPDVRALAPNEAHAQALGATMQVLSEGIDADGRFGTSRKAEQALQMASILLAMDQPPRPEADFTAAAHRLRRGAEVRRCSDPPSYDLERIFTPLLCFLNATANYASKGLALGLLTGFVPALTENQRQTLALHALSHLVPSTAQDFRLRRDAYPTLWLALYAADSGQIAGLMVNLFSRLVGRAPWHGSIDGLALLHKALSPEHVERLARPELIELANCRRPSKRLGHALAVLETLFNRLTNPQRAALIQSLVERLDRLAETTPTPQARVQQLHIGGYQDVTALCRLLALAVPYLSIDECRRFAARINTPLLAASALGLHAPLALRLAHEPVGQQLAGQAIRIGANQDARLIDALNDVTYAPVFFTEVLLAFVEPSPECCLANVRLYASVVLATFMPALDAHQLMELLIGCDDVIDASNLDCRLIQNIYDLSKNAALRLAELKLSEADRSHLFCCLSDGLQNTNLPQAHLELSRRALHLLFSPREILWRSGRI
jgi:hypothetical protein